MASRLQQMNVYPWTGGLVTSIDESMIQPNQLTVANNVQFSTQGTRLKRGGIDADWDDLSIVSVSRSSATTTRTLVTTGHKWTIGDQFYTTGSANTAYNSGTVLATVSAIDSTSKSTVTFPNTNAVVTITEASPGVVTWTAHGLSNGDRVYLTTAGTLPTNLAASTVYYVVNKATDTFQLALTSGGAAIITTGAIQSGVHTGYYAVPLIAWTANGLANGDPIIFTSSGTLPTELVSGRPYFVVNAATDSFAVASTPGGTALSIITEGSGTHTAREALENIISYTFSGAASLAEASTPDVAVVITLATRVIAFCDYWYGATSAKTHRLAAFTSAGRLYLIDTTSGVRTLISDIGTTYTIPTGGLTKASVVVFDNRLMVATEGAANGLKHYFPTDFSGSGVLEDVTNTAGFDATPKPSFLQTHLGRLWCNDKAMPDRLHYCETGNYAVWQGAGDSGAMDIGAGDGDPEGLTAIFPPFKGVMFVAKRTKLYKMSGQYPENFYPERVASSLGCVSHQAVAAVDQDDVIFVSDKGVHSSVTTDAYGDFAQNYISADIQKTINDLWVRSRQKFIQAAYLPQTNSVAFCVAEDDDTTQQQVYLYNVALKQWYKWPSISCAAVCVSNDTDQQRFYFGRNDGRVAQSATGQKYDVDTDGDQTAIPLTITTGIIYPNNNILNTNAFKRLGLVFKPSGVQSFTVTLKIDNFSTQVFTFTNGGTQDLLGSTFILGTSILGLRTQVASTYTQPVDGYGRGFKLTVEQTGVDEFGELFGFVMFYEPSEPVNETRTSDTE